MRQCEFWPLTSRQPLSRFQWNLKLINIARKHPPCQTVFWSDKVGGLGKHRLCQCKVSTFFIFFLFVRWTGHTGRLILTIYTSYDLFPHKDVLFWGCVDTTPNLGVHQVTKTPVTRARLGIFKPNMQNFYFIKTTAYCIDSNQIWHTNKDHQVCFMSGQRRKKQIQD